MGTTRHGWRMACGLTGIALLGAGLAPASGAADGGDVLGRNAIVFQSLRADNDDIYVIDVDGTDERRLTTVPAADGAPALSPDRRTVAFASDRTGQMQLWTMHADGSDQRRLLASGSFDFHPAWSHDGRSIVFQRRSATTGFDLWVLDVASGAERQLTSLPRNEVGAWFSPDDEWVVFGGNNGTSPDVWRVPTTGGSPTVLTSGVCIAGTAPCVPAFDGQPSWTPDGRVLFLSDRSGGIAVWTMAADGTDAEPVIDLGSASAGMPSMAANGQRITFVSDVHDLGAGRNVYTVRADGRQLRRVTWTGDDLAPQFAW